jgi:hypothetical protein
MVRLAERGASVLRDDPIVLIDAFDVSPAFDCDVDLLAPVLRSSGGGGGDASYV